MKSIRSLFVLSLIVLGSLFVAKDANACSSCQSGHGYVQHVRVRPTYYRVRNACYTCGVRPFSIFTGTRLQFRAFQPVRNALRLVGRVGFRTGLLLTGRPAFPGLRRF